MKSASVKTVSVYMKKTHTFKYKPTWIFDTSDTTAEQIMTDYVSASPILKISNVPASKSTTMTLMLNKSEIAYVTIE